MSAHECQGTQITITNSPLSPLEIITLLLPESVKGKGLGFTLRLLQQTDVIQLTDGGERFCAALQLAAKAEVAYPVPARRHDAGSYIRPCKVVTKYQLWKTVLQVESKKIRSTRDCGKSLPSSAWRTGPQEDESGETGGVHNPSWNSENATCSRSHMDSLYNFHFIILPCGGLKGIK